MVLAVRASNLMKARITNLILRARLPLLSLKPSSSSAHGKPRRHLNFIFVKVRDFEEDIADIVALCLQYLGGCQRCTSGK